MSSLLKLIIPSLILGASASSAEIYVPDALRDWQQWVLQDKEYRDCPFYFNRNAADRQDFICAWPGQLQLSVESSGAEFTQRWTVYAQEQWLALPGGVDYWPDNVTVNDRPIEVIARNDVPGVRLGPGSYSVAGRFEWDERPGVLRLPPQSGLVALIVDGRKVERPEVSRGTVFLGERKSDSRVVDSVRTEVHRLVVDDVPTRLITQLQIDVSGSMREELFGPVLPDGFVPLTLQSLLPARLEADGRLRLQVRPGRWTIFLNARGPAVLSGIVRQAAGENMPAAEIWSYQSNDRLRVTAAAGLPPVDPGQVQVPASWANFPAFRAEPGATLTITERSRGVVAATNELNLVRTLWLDFDGEGFHVKDSISGRMRSGWRLDMQPPYTLLNATENGQSLLITRGQEEGQSGVELRQTDVNLSALGRSNARAAMPVSGWDARFSSVQATLNLPPGNKLVAAPGVDSARGSWASQWQLLDFFLVLIITTAVWRMLGRGAGVVAFLALVLGFHEPFAPSWLWLNLLIAIALMRVAPAGRLRQIVTGYQVLSAAALLVALVPFIANQLRIAIYPQLEPQYNQYQLYDYGVAEVPATAEMPQIAKQSAPRRQAGVIAEESGMLDSTFVSATKPTVDFARYAPNAIVQAGPGIPSWQWNTYTLGWSGPVDVAQTMRLVVLPRWLVSVLRVAEIALLLLFAALLAAEILNKRWSLPGGFKLGRNPAAAVLGAAILATTLTFSPAAEAQLPDEKLLQQLEQRLSKPPDCVPRCAEVVSAAINVRGNDIEMRLGIHAMEDVAIPLPGAANGLQPHLILIDGRADALVFRAADNSLWLQVSPGRHAVTLRGPIPEVDSLEIAFQSPPRVIEVESDGWFVAGIKDRRLLSGSLQLTRLQSGADGDATVRWESSRFPAFARIERSVELDLDWRVTTSVYRVAPAEGALTLDVPLIRGEKIVSGDFAVDNNRVLVSMNPQQQSISWTSNLPRTSPLTLTAEDGASWNEVWRFAVGNIWHAEFEGLPESDTGGDVSDIRIAEFNPRGGEQLRLAATRPEGADGSTLAFDSVNLAVTHGSRSSDTTLRLAYRSTRGAQHVLRLPEGAEVMSVQIDDRAQSMRAQGGELTLPILPGEHAIQVDWQKSGSMTWRTTTPSVDLGAPSGNIEMSLTKPRERWLLFTTGPALGPAVLYWSELAVLIVFALILGRIGLAPLSSWHWLLLGLGFSTFSWPALGVVVVWLLACGVRERWQTEVNWWRFNLIQVGIAALTVMALTYVMTSLPLGLLGTPDMHVSGYGSDGTVLRWFADRSDAAVPIASVVSVPLWMYKVLILAWALWLSFALLRWLPWVWRCFSSHGYWRSKKNEVPQSSGEGK